MRILFAILLLGTFSSFAYGRDMNRCELARELKKYEVDNVEDWVCLAMAETRGTLRTDFDENRGFGLFQIPPKYCGFTSDKGGICRTSCLNFMDGSLWDDVLCAKHVMKREGLDRWRGWSLRCKDMDRKKLLSDCWGINSVMGLPNLFRMGLSDLLG